MHSENNQTLLDLNHRPKRQTTCSAQQPHLRWPAHVASAGVVPSSRPRFICCCPTSHANNARHTSLALQHADMTLADFTEHNRWPTGADNKRQNLSLSPEVASTCGISGCGSKQLTTSSSAAAHHTTKVQTGDRVCYDRQCNRCVTQANCT
jgi:hypothetical protein